MSSDEIALYRKLVFREARTYLCLDCLSNKMRVCRRQLEEIIEYYHTTGLCQLFAKRKARLDQ